ncbi:MAG TPA: alpha-L-fucosidase [Steroidobacteraceae bacterium]|nr:alpha-L-fucosidase [Steroidobacteraceae bacterium]
MKRLRSAQASRMPCRFALTALWLVACGALAPVHAESPTASQTAREWFQDARFGMFIHWGVYSVPARGEWVMEHEHIPVSEYEKFAPQFNPTQFSARDIVSLAKRAGMKYITITSKHHDGFAMWATRQSRWNIVDATPYKQDPLKALSAEAHRQGIKLFFYYSLLDWHSTDYWPLGRTGHFAGRPPGGDFDRYLDYMDAQLTELLTQYGPVGGIWFDGMWDKPDADWEIERTYALIHRLQPAALIGNNHHRAPLPGEDFQMFEQDLPGENSAGFNKAGVSGLPLETCETINHSWGYTREDKDFKSVPQLIHLLVRAAGANANFLLNVGPTAEGLVQPQFVERLEAMGDWLETHGETIYGTRAGPISPRSWGVTTAKGERIYVHILDWQEPYLVLPPLTGVKAAWAFDTHRKAQLTPMKGAMLLAVPAAAPDVIDRIVVLER